MAGAGSRRPLATSMADETERYSVNGLLGLSSNVALYVLGPVAGGLMVAADGPGAVLFVDACGALLLMACVLPWVPRTAAESRESADADAVTREAPVRVKERRSVVGPMRAAVAARACRDA